MTTTPDRFPGAREEASIVFEEDESDPTVAGELKRVVGKGLRIFEDGSARGVGESKGNVWQPPVVDCELDDPPGSPEIGDRYLIGPSPTGSWGGHAREIAEWDGSTWTFTAPKRGTILYVACRDEALRQVADSAPWSWSLLRAPASYDEAFSFRDHFLQGDYWNTAPFYWDADIWGGSIADGVHFVRLRSGCVVGQYASIFGKERIEVGNPDLWTYRWRSKVVAESGSSEAYDIFAGVQKDYDNRIVVERGSCANTIKFVTSNGGSATTTDDIPVDPHYWHEYAVVATSGSVKLYVDGSIRASHTTNLTSQQLHGYFNCATLEAAYKHLEIDYVALTMGSDDHV